MRLSQFDIIQNTADWNWTTQTGIHKHTSTHLSVLPKVIKKSVNKLITSWQLPTKTDLRSLPSRLFLCPRFFFTLLCQLSPFLYSSSLFWLLQKVHSFPSHYLSTRTLCTIVLFAIGYHHSPYPMPQFLLCFPVHPSRLIAPYYSCQQALYASWFL